MADNPLRLTDPSDSLSKKGGGKLNRSETVTVRLDPKLNYMCELAARTQRRTKSSFIEWSVAESLSAVILPEVLDRNNWETPRPVTLQEKASALWQVDEADRLVALAFIAPALLTHEEQLIWKHIRENGFLWKGRYHRGEWTWDINEDDLVRSHLRDTWELFRDVALGDRPRSDLPTWRRIEPGGELDDEVPF